ncbi:MAG TPA: sigma 54-interacting transcriptional regulator, partial [Gemmataceae bacterium]|nr:sigma 54-interacting transcriptional regulator [Gemmataceae bacterium]
QAKLLRVLQTGRFERVGGGEALEADVRVIAATNRDLPARIAEGRFREDLYYRLNVVSLEMPPLRQRREDIATLADHIVRRLAAKYGWPHLALDPEAISLLVNRAWPGNVRELQNVLSRAAILVRGSVIGPADLSPETPAPEQTPVAAPAGSLLLRDILAETERRVIRQALEQEQWNRTRAAQVLGISRRQLFDKIRQYGLQE